jgi:acetylornithine/N-succinyldiaminopimelate aminotransferase
VTLEQVKKLEGKFLVPTYERYPVLLRKGRGVHVYDHKGRKYLDFLSGIGVSALGHAHPAITKAIAKQSRLLVHTSNLFYTEYQGKLAAALTKISGMERAFFTNSGTEAWEGALKFARAYAKENCHAGQEPKWRFLALEHAFHGRTFGSLATTHKEKYRAPFAPGVPGVEFVRFNDVDDLEKKFDSTVCAIGFEFVQGEGGIRPVSKEFANKARELADKHGALLIADEIQSGLGRTGKWFAYQHFGIKPDMVTLAKPIAGGLPLGALLVTDKVSQAIHPGMHGTTFGGGPLACAVALELLHTMDRDKLLKHIQKTGSYLFDQLRDLQKKHACIRDVRGMGLMGGVELESADLAKDVFKQLLERGVIVNRTDETVIRMLPPFIIKKQHVDQVVRLLDAVLSKDAVALTAAQRRQK